MGTPGGWQGPAVPPPYGYIYLPPGWGPPPPVARPHGAPSRALFVIGAIGHFLAAGALVVFAFAGFGGLAFSFGLSGSAVLALAGSVLLFCAILLHLFGFLGLWKNYGVSMGAVCFGFGIAPAILPFLAIVLALTLRGFGSYFLVFLMVLLALILLGVLFILEGATYLAIRHFTSNPGLNVATGVMFIVGGAFVCSDLLAFVGFFVLVAPLIMGGIVLLQAPVPIAPGSAGPWHATPPPLRSP